ncbi:MAG TPA: DUF1440 domain-containing protein [Gemmatimonadaceae bacterium]|nr:DUF1440 domain-containing protein [Gemmatimonadaceae bacterium]
MAQARNVMTRVLDGAVAGAVATWLMGKVTSFLYARENAAAREREDRARHGTTAYGVAAQRTAEAFDVTLSPEQRKTYGRGLHWALGIGAGALYGALRRELPGVAVADGLAFGLGFFLLMDEGLVYLMGLTPGPQAFPWQTHARGLAGHLVFGTTANTILSVIESAA